MGNVISALGDEQRKPHAHVPYRDSKLTRLLQGMVSKHNYGNMFISRKSTDSPRSLALSNVARIMVRRPLRKKSAKFKNTKLKRLVNILRSYYLQL